MSEQPETALDPEPALSPKLLTTDEEFLERAVEKWLKFQTGMWDNVNRKLEPEIKTSQRWSIALRVIIILLSAAVTTISNIDAITRNVVTITAGLLTALTGIEAFLQAGEREAAAKKQQREIEALRDKLRYEWFVRVEIEGAMEKRLIAAKEMLERGPNEYNDILTKYALKADNPDKPHMNA